MNLGQLLEGVVGKAVWKCDELIKANPNNAPETINWLNNNVIKFLGDPEYFNRINSSVEILKNDKTILNNWVENIQNSNLFIESPAFSEVDLKGLLKNVKPNILEPVLIKKELIDYMKDKLDIMKDVTITSDITLKNIFVSKMYIQKLYKLSEKIISCRDLGPVKSITKQPMRGRARNGGSTVGQMEIESIVANGCMKSLRELMTVKNDHNDEKRRLMSELIRNGEYYLPDEKGSESRTKTVVNTILKFLKD